MFHGYSPAERAIGKQLSERLMAKADADREAPLAGHKSLFRRLLERLRPHRQNRSATRSPSLPYSAATGAALLAVERCSLARVQIAVQDSHSAPGLLYLIAVRRLTCQRS